MDDLSIALNNSGIGGYLGDAFLNHLCYAVLQWNATVVKHMLELCY